MSFMPDAASLSADMIELTENCEPARLATHTGRH